MKLSACGIACCQKKKQTKIKGRGENKMQIADISQIVANSRHASLYTQMLSGWQIYKCFNSSLHPS